MDKYSIAVTRSAEQDMTQIVSYISGTLFDPLSAKRIYRALKEQIEMPQRFGLIAEEPYASMGIRKIPVENYLIFYFVNEKKREVQVLRVLYNRREWHSLI